MAAERSASASFNGRVELVMARNREDFVFHQDPRAEWELLHHVRNGNPAGVREAWKRLDAGKFGTLSRRSRLRNKKNLAICGITLATRAAIDGGLYWEEAYTLSDLYIQHIEELAQPEEVDAALLDAFLDFAGRVRGGRSAGVSRAVAVCQNYIFNHLYSDIRLDDLARAVRLSPAYLSGKFRKETGMTMREFILRERIEEAKRLLVLTDDSIAAIGSRLSFCDQTHFGKAFKKRTGMTPRQYRQRYGIFGN